MEDYFSIDDILASEPRIYCTFRTEGALLAHLDPIGVAAHHASTDVAGEPNMHNIPRNHRLALPFWLIESLATRNFIAVELPRCYSTSTRNALRADARSVDLYARCQSYFTLGVRLSKLLIDILLPGVLVRAYASRCWKVADIAVLEGGRGADAMSKLDLLERRLFFAAHNVDGGLRKWKERRCDRIEGFESLLGKRLRDDALGSPVTPTAKVRVS